MIRLAMTMLAATPLLAALPAAAKERAQPRPRHAELYTPPTGVTLMPLPPLTLRPGMARPDPLATPIARTAETPGPQADSSTGTRRWLSGR